MQNILELPVCLREQIAGIEYRNQAILYAFSLVNIGMDKRKDMLDAEWDRGTLDI